MYPDDLFDTDFSTLSELIEIHQRHQPNKPALISRDEIVTYGDLNASMNRIAASMQRDGVMPGHAIAICCAETSLEYATVFFGALRACAVIAPLAPSSTPTALLAQIDDCQAKLVFLDKAVAEALGDQINDVQAKCVLFETTGSAELFNVWLADPDTQPVENVAAAEQPFNIIYSSGTTGVPKGIVQSHAMRWSHMCRAVYPNDGVTILSTPLYSNTTLVALLPTIAAGATAILLPRFSVENFLVQAEKYRATHAMLVPIQYRRLLASADFDKYDLSAFQLKFSTSAPLSEELKREIIARWPGGLVEFYGMTEGGGTCTLACHEYPDKLHTVGRPLPDHDIRLIDEQGKEVEQGVSGEVVGRSRAMMLGYHNQPGKTSEAEWYSPDGLKYIRTGDIGRFDADGFLTLIDRRKDVIISGGFNIYPSDLENEIIQCVGVDDVSVVGVGSSEWGETPVAFVVLSPDFDQTKEELKQWINQRVGKTQRVNDVVCIDSLPRSPIGKVLKRELRDRYELQH